MFCLAFSVLVNAQTENSDTSIVEGHDLQEVTVIKDGRRRALRSASPLHILGRGDMLRSGVTDIGDALHRLAGVVLRDYGGAGGMKTVSVRGFGSKHTGVSYDGVMLGDGQSGEIDLSRYSLENVDELSLVIGEGDDIFIPARQSSVSAVLNVRTLPAGGQALSPVGDSSSHLPAGRSHAHLTAQLKMGSFGYVSPFVRYEQSFSKGLSVAVTGEYVYAENDYPFTLRNVSLETRQRRTNSAMSSGHGEADIVWNIDERRRLSGKVYYYDNDRRLPGQVRYYTDLSKERLHDRNFFVQMGYQSRQRSGLWLKWLGKFNWSGSMYRDALMSGGVNDADYWQREAYSALCLMYAPGGDWLFDYSADYIFNNLNGSSWRTVVGRPYRHGVLQSASVKYSKGGLVVLGRLLYSLYLNGDRSKEGAHGRNMRRLSPSLSLSYKPFEMADFYLRASYKNIFRVPTFNENYYYHYGSTDLKAESTDQINVGITYGVERGAWSAEQMRSIQLSVDGYWGRVRDMIVAVPYNMFVWTCVNVDKVRSYGLDLTAKGVYGIGGGHCLLLSGNYSYQRVSNRNNPSSYTYGYQIAYVPRHSGSLALTWENPWVNLSFHGVATSGRWPNNEHYEGTMIRGFIDCGITAYRDFKIGNSTMGCRLDLKNIFDKQYEIVARYPMPGRSYQISINYKL